MKNFKDEAPQGASEAVYKFNLSSKAAFRKSVRHLLESFSEKKIPKAPGEISDLCDQAQSIGSYAPISKWKEPELSFLTEHREKLCFPKVFEDQMKFFRGAELVESDHISGLKEPEGGQEVNPDLIFVPALAIDHSGTRIGKGGGFYDRYLEHKTNVTKVGVCLDEFLVEIFSSDLKQVHDVKMDFVMTPKKYFRTEEKLS